MRKTIIIICLTLSAAIILDSMNAWQVIAMFYIAGEIPGTHSSIGAGTMLELFALLIGFVIARISNRAVLSFFDRRTSSFTQV